MDEDEEAPRRNFVSLPQKVSKSKPEKTIRRKQLKAKTKIISDKIKKKRQMNKKQKKK